jgi:hypothetical protein
VNMRLTGRVGAVTVAALALAGAAGAASPLASLPSGWSHAAVNVVGPKGQGHTVVYDRGKVTAVGSLTLTLKESDGSIVTIPIAADATVKLDGATATLAQVQPGDNAITVCIDSSPAIRLQATAPPPPPVITHGRVVAVGSSSLTLKEQDGTVVTIAVAPNAVVKVNGQPGQLSQIQSGFSATVATVGDLPARAVRSHGKSQSTASTGSATPSSSR